jgi:hypothetical protein
VYDLAAHGGKLYAHPIGVESSLAWSRWPIVCSIVRRGWQFVEQISGNRSMCWLDEDAARCAQVAGGSNGYLGKAERRCVRPDGSTHQSWSMRVAMSRHSIMRRMGRM